MLFALTGWTGGLHQRLSMLELDAKLQADLRALAQRWLQCTVHDDTASTAALAARLRGAVRPMLRHRGAARLQLIEQPQQQPLPTLERLLMGLSQALGFVLPQTHRLNLLAHIQDEGSDYARHSTRGHQTNASLAFHSDRCDLNLLLYVRVAPRGGELSVVAYEEAAQRLRELDAPAYEALFDGFPFDLRDERIFASLAWHWRPILWRHNGGLRGHYIRRFITDSQRHDDCPRLSERQQHALNRFDTVLESMREEHAFAPRAGELVLLNNYRVMHARTGFDDAPEPAAKRLALRTWVAPFDSEPLPLALHALAGSCIARSYRGGVGCGAEYLGRLGQTRIINMTEHA